VQKLRQQRQFRVGGRLPREGRRNKLPVVFHEIRKIGDLGVGLAREARDAELILLVVAAGAADIECALIALVVAELADDFTGRLGTGTLADLVDQAAGGVLSV
jgi:hypothetical protein